MYHELELDVMKLDGNSWWMIFPSSHNHGSEKWIPPVLVTFQILSITYAKSIQL